MDVRMLAQMPAFPKSCAFSASLPSMNFDFLRERGREGERGEGDEREREKKHTSMCFPNAPACDLNQNLVP